MSIIGSTRGWPIQKINNSRYIILYYYIPTFVNRSHTLYGQGK